MDKTAIVNASPLIFLSRGRQIGILRHFAYRTLVPEPVAEEIRRKGISDITSQTLEDTPWIEVELWGHPIIPLSSVLALGVISLI